MQRYSPSSVASQTAFQPPMPRTRRSRFIHRAIRCRDLSLGMCPVQKNKTVEYRLPILPTDRQLRAGNLQQIARQRLDIRQIDNIGAVDTHEPIRREFFLHHRKRGGKRHSASIGPADCTVAVHRLYLQQLIQRNPEVFALLPYKRTLPFRLRIKTHAPTDRCRRRSPCRSYFRRCVPANPAAAPTKQPPAACPDPFYEKYHT